MRDLGTPALPIEWFNKIAEAFPKTAVFCVVYWGDQPAAGGCGFTWRDEFEISWASSLQRYNRYAPNMLLYCRLMEEMIKREISVFNFGRCPPGSGTHRFKRQWGGEDTELPWAQWSSSGKRGTPSRDSSQFSVARAIWQRLPLSVANRLGPSLARYLP
jgi:CelD/BcsL family acetyltransferase involved in cellulose biosynthesis